MHTSSAEVNGYPSQIYAYSYRLCFLFIFEAYRVHFLRVSLIFWSAMRTKVDRQAEIGKILGGTGIQSRLVGHYNGKHTANMKRRFSNGDQKNWFASLAQRT